MPVLGVSGRPILVALTVILINSISLSLTQVLCPAPTLAC